MTNHTEKEAKTYKGKNIRVSEEFWNKLRKYCFNRNITMKDLVEEVVTERMKTKK